MQRESDRIYCLLLCQLSASGDSGMPEVVADPLGEVANTFQDLGVCVVQQCAKIRQQGMLIFFQVSVEDLTAKMDQSNYF